MMNIAYQYHTCKIECLHLRLGKGIEAKSCNHKTEMGMCVCVCMYICVVCVCVHHMCVRMCGCTCMCVCGCMCGCTCVCVCTYVYLCVCVCVCTLCVYIVCVCSILKPFIYDPLVEWSKPSKEKRSNPTETGEITNEQVVYFFAFGFGLLSPTHFFHSIK